MLKQSDEIVTVNNHNNVRVHIENLGEGFNGEFDPSDPDDRNLVRFTVYYNGAQVDDASYCTGIEAAEPYSELYKMAHYILERVEKPVLAGESIKRLCEDISWFNFSWLKDDKAKGFVGEKLQVGRKKSNNIKPEKKFILKIKEDKIVI